MVSIPPEFAGAFRFISDLFQIRPEWLVFPNIITVFLVPLFFNIWMFQLVLEKILKVFPGTGVNWIIGGVMGFLMLPYNDITRFVAPLIIGMFAVENKFWKFALVVILYVFYLVILPWVAGLAQTGFRI